MAEPPDLPCDGGLVRDEEGERSEFRRWHLENAQGWDEDGFWARHAEEKAGDRQWSVRSWGQCPEGFRGEVVEGVEEFDGQLGEGDVGGGAEGGHRGEEGQVAQRRT